MTELSVEYILLFLIVVFLFYHFLGNCGCKEGFSVGGQKCSEYDNKEVCDDPCEWNDKTNTCSEKSEFCNPNTYPKQFCSGGIPCPDCGFNLCKCPKSQPGKCECLLPFKEHPAPMNFPQCFNFWGELKSDKRGCQKAGITNSVEVCTKNKSQESCEKRKQINGVSNLCKWTPII